MPSAKFHNSFRKYHRWLGFFLAGIMAVYAISGVLLIFRKTDFLKFEYSTQQTLSSGLNAEQLGEQLRIRQLSVKNETPSSIVFEQGDYNKQSGVAQVSKKDYPIVLAKLVSLHKATTSSPLFYLNIFFGLSLLFFVVSAFVMFLPKALTHNKSLKIAGAGFIFALLVVIFAS